MPIIHSLSILFSRFNIIFKMILYFLIVSLILGSLALCFLNPIFSNVKSEFESTGIIEKAKTGFHQFIQGDPEYANTLSEVSLDWQKVSEAFNSSKLALSIVVTVIFLFIAKYFFTLAYISYSDIINEFMSSNSRYGFLSNFISNLKKSALYSLLFLVTEFPFSIAIWAVAYFLFQWLYTAVSIIFALPMVILFLLFMNALRSTVFAGWLPAIVYEKKPVAIALRDSIKSVKKIFGSAYSVFLIAQFLSIIWIFICVVPTFGAGLLIAVPTVIMVFKICELVIFYNAKGYKYYINDSTVIQKPVITK